MRATHVADGKKEVQVDVGVIIPSRYLRGVYHGEVELCVKTDDETLYVELIVRDQHLHIIETVKRAFSAHHHLHVTAPRRPK